MLARDNEEAGQSLTEARTSAARVFGRMGHIKEQCRDVSRFVGLHAFWQDVRYAVRTLARSPVFTAVAVLSLAVGIGANIGVFALLRDVVFASYPYPEADRVVMVGMRFAKFETLGGVSVPIFEELEEISRSTESLGLFRTDDFTVDWDREPVVEQAMQVAPSLFEVLAVEPLIGRRLLPSDGDVRGGGVVVLTYSSWQHHFGGDPNVLGREISE